MPGGFFSSTLYKIAWKHVRTSLHYPSCMISFERIRVPRSIDTTPCTRKGWKGPPSNKLSHFRASTIGLKTCVDVCRRLGKERGDGRTTRCARFGMSCAEPPRLLPCPCTSLEAAHTGGLRVGTGEFKVPTTKSMHPFPILSHFHAPSSFPRDDSVTWKE